MTCEHPTTIGVIFTEDRKTRMFEKSYNAGTIADVALKMHQVEFLGSIFRHDMLLVTK